MRTFFFSLMRLFHISGIMLFKRLQNCGICYLHYKFWIKPMSANKVRHGLLRYFIRICYKQALRRSLPYPFHFLHPKNPALNS